jgi:hypothetical protein
MAYAYRVKVGADTSSLTDITSYIDLESFSLSSNFDDRLPRCEFGMIDDWKATGGTAPVTLRLWWVVQVERSAIGDWSDTDVRFIGVITGIDRAQVGSGNLVAVTASGWKIVLTTDILTGDSYKWGTVGSQSYFHTSEESNVTYTILSNDNSAPTDKIPKMFYDLDTAHTWKMDANNPTITTKKLFDLRGKSVAEAMDEICDALELNWTINWDGSGNKTVIVQRNAYSGQKITNPEFESTTGGWTYTSSARTAGAGRSAAATDYGWLSTSAAGLCTQTVGATAGVRYLLLANLGAKRGSSANTSVTLNMNWKNSGGTTISTTTTSYTSTSTSLTWAYKELIATAPVGTTQVQIELDAGGTFTGGGQVNADNIYMIEQTAPFGISWTPDDSSTYAPQEWSEPVQAEQPINKVYIYGDTTAARGWYSNYASYAYFNRWFEGYESDTEIKTQSQAEERSRKIFSEHAFPRVEGSYTIHQHGLVAGQNQIIENAITQQNAVFTIVGIEERPIGSGKVEYKVSYGAHPRNRYTQIITAMSGATPTSNPTSSAPKNSPAVSAPMMTQSVGWSTVSAASVAATSGVSDFPNVETLAPQNRQPLVVQRTSGQTDANALAAATLPYEELPAGRMTLVVPETGVTTQPVLYRVDSTGAAWETVTPTNLRATAIANGTLSQGMIVADSIVAGTIDASVINVSNLNATNIKTGALTIDAAFDANAITSTNFTVTNTGAVTAKQLTLNPSTSETQGIDTAAGAIKITPPDGFGAAILKVTNTAGTDDFDVVQFNSATAAAANAVSTITTDSTHSLKAGQMVSFHSVQTDWNLITPTAPIQILSVTPTTFTIKHFLALPAVASNSAGTIRAYKRLSVRAAGGFYVYRDSSKAGDIAAGSLVLGDNLANYGNGSLATVADGEIAFIKAGGTTPRYGNGANLYSSNGTTNVSTSGNFAANSVTTTLVSTTSDLSLQADGGDIIVRHGAGAGVNPRILFRNGAGTYISGLRATVGTLTHYADSGTSTLGNFTSGAINGSSITASGNVISNGTGFLNDTPTTAATPSTYTSGRAAFWTNTAGTAYRLDRYVASSSAETKKNITSTDVAPEQFYGINLVDFEFDNERAKALYPSVSVTPEGVQHGIIYEQVKDIMPEAVFDAGTSGPGDPPGINWDQVYFAALVAIQDLNDRVRDLEARLKEAEGND